MTPELAVGRQNLRVAVPVLVLLLVKSGPPGHFEPPVLGPVKMPFSSLNAPYALSSCVGPAMSCQIAPYATPTLVVVRVTISREGEATPMDPLLLK
jgi:hypothetical protein